MLPVTNPGHADARPPDPRRALLLDWLAGQDAALGLRPESLRPASVDASFRRYFRVDASGRTLIAVDAPPQHEDSAMFVTIAGWLAGAGVNAPAIVAADVERGLLLLGDLGERTYFDALRAGAAPEPLYADALAALVKMQTAPPPALAPYDRQRFATELALFPDWYVGRHLGVALDPTETARLQQAFDALLANLAAQPTLFVHRDFHCRNLMAVAERNPGVLDFQGALIGPITYDLVSLLRDAYVEWDEELQIDWAVRYWERARRSGLPVGADFGVFWRDFEWIGLQRHLKVLGLFARLAHRDGKPRYLGDCPRVLGYARRAAGRYDALAPIARLLDRLAGQEPVVRLTF